MQEIDWNILKRSVKGDLSDEEKRGMAAWLSESEDNRRYYRKMQKFFGVEMDEEVDVSGNFKEFEIKTYGRRRRKLVVVLKYAAAIVLLVGSVLLWRGLTTDTGEPGNRQFVLSPGMEKAVLYTASGEQILLESHAWRNIIVADSFQVRQDSNLLNYTALSTAGAKMINETHTMRVPRGGEFSMMLSDGTMVYLNAETSLRYPVQFNEDERRVSLSGEAYFDVVKAGKPFIVEVNGFEVKVLGTRFNIHAYNGEAQFETTLEQGCVEVKTGERTLLLEPGEQAVLTKEGGLSKQKVDVNRYTAWKNGQFVFDDERLEDVMNTVARWYDIKVFYQNQSVREIRINGNISRYKDFSVLLEKIEKLDVAQFEIKGNTIIVKSR